MAQRRETHLQRHFIYYFTGGVCLFSFVFMFYAVATSDGELKNNITIQSNTAVIAILMMAAGYFLRAIHSPKKSDEEYDNEEKTVLIPEHTELKPLPKDKKP